MGVEEARRQELKRPTKEQRRRNVRITIAQRRTAWLARPRFKTRRHQSTTVIAHAPSHFTLQRDAERAKLIVFIGIIKKAVNEGRRCKIDFKSTKHLHPSGTLYFICQIQSLVRSAGSRLTCNYPKDQTVEQLFQHIGFLRACGLRERANITADNVKHWHFVKGESSDASPFKALLESYSEEMSSSEQSTTNGIPPQNGLYDSMSEAITNAIQHAYKDADREKMGWCMFAQKRDGRLYVAIADVGIGIAGSLRNNPVWRDFVKRLLYKRAEVDKRLLSAAIGTPRTSTKLDHRGKGLPEMLNFVKSLPGSKFAVFSNFASFTYAQRREHGTSHSKSLKGTIVLWDLPLTGGGFDENA